MKLWNPVAFFISLIMSLLMPLIFATSMGMPIEICLLYWPLRWLVAYMIVTIFARPASLKLAKKIFGFEAG
ncbi:MAG: hypothetical protein Q4P18_07795 [Methanobrevibacter sp.]|nr:hypothetical protein [Methanobrevibacter sp.]